MAYMSILKPVLGPYARVQRPLLELHRLAGMHHVLPLRFERHLAEVRVILQMVLRRILDDQFCSVWIPLVICELQVSWHRS